MLSVIVITVALSVAMTTLSLLFLFHRGSWLRDRIIKGWSPRRREVLKLSALNGFDLLREKLHDWSLYPLIMAGAAVWLSEPARQATWPYLLVAVGCTWRYVARLFVARSKRSEADIPLEYDGFGSYARAHRDWREISKELMWKTAVCLSITIIYLVMWAVL